MRRSGRSFVSALLLLLAACHFPYGFKGGGLPPEIDSMAVLPFDNKTASSTVQQELLEQMRGEMRRRLGVREAPEDRAKAIVRGAKGKRVTVVGFGTFLPRKRKARAGRSPVNGKEIRIDAKTIPAFAAGQGFKEAVSKD